MKKQKKETVWDGETPIKPYTLRELRKKPNSDNVRFHYQFIHKKRKLYGICFTSLDPRGMRVPIAVVYRHLCGDVVLVTTPLASLRLDVIKRWVLPIMEDYDRWLHVAKDAQRLCRIPYPKKG